MWYIYGSYPVLFYEDKIRMPKKAKLVSLSKEDVDSIRDLAMVLDLNDSEVVHEGIRMLIDRQTGRQLREGKDAN